MVSEVRLLQDLCRLAIRASLMRASAGRDILQHVQALPIPGRFKDYLGYKTPELEENLAYVTPDLTVHSLSSDSDADN